MQVETGFSKCICIHGIRIRVSESEGISHSPRGTPQSFLHTPSVKSQNLSIPWCCSVLGAKRDEEFETYKHRSNWNDVEIFNFNLLENLWAIDS